MPYDGSTSNTMRLRLLVGDTSTSSAGELLSTGEANYFISTFGTVRAAAPHAARAIQAFFATKASKEVGDLAIDYSRRADSYGRMADTLSRSIAVTAAIPYAGGISIADKDTVADDSDRVVPAFKIGLHDNAGSTST